MNINISRPIKKAELLKVEKTAKIERKKLNAEERYERRMTRAPKKAQWSDELTQKDFERVATRRYDRRIAKLDNKQEKINKRFNRKVAKLNHESGT